jgi:soluble lytic murein transglycosylase-like protein
MNNAGVEPRCERGPGRGWLPLLLILTTVPTWASDLAFEELQRGEDPALLMEWGQRYFYGVRAPQSMDRAIQLYCAAARLGSGEAQYRLGEIYARTLAGKRDEVLAAAWLIKASLSKYNAAKARLAQWDLTDVALAPEPECVLSGQMVARTVPRVRRAAQAAPPEPEPKPKPAIDAPKLTNHPRRGEIERLVRDLAPGFGLNPALVLAVVEVESRFNPNAQSPKRAQGLMQLIPATAQRFGVADPWDPHQNLRGGMAYLRWLLDHFDGDLRLALAGYNAGEQAVTRHGGIPPYTETRNYVRRVARVLGVTEEALDSIETRPAGVATPRKTEAETDWQRRFFAVDKSG